MIVELHVENLAIIDRAELAFGPGFTVLTGETGAGKSLIIDALELAFGARADTDSVRDGATRAFVHVALDLSERPDIVARCRDLGALIDDDLLTIQREVMAEGRSTCRINGKMSTVSVLRSIGNLLVDLHGQHDHQSLLRPEDHVGFLDSWIGEPAQKLLGAVRAELEAYRDLKSRLSAVRRSTHEREQRLDLLRFQIQEIEAAAPEIGEFGSLESELTRRQNSERFRLQILETSRLLFDDDRAALDRLRTAFKLIEEMSAIDSELAPILENLATSLFALEDMPQALSTYAETIDADPERLEEIAARMDTLRTLRRKYGLDESAVLEHLVRAQTELAELESAEVSEAELEESLALSEARLKLANQALTQLRTGASIEFSMRIEEQLQELSMERAVFGIRFESQEPDETGSDLIEFEFSANAGEPKRPLAKIASGGELSRVMLALKSIMAGKVGVPVLIFDEVDAGMGGRAAAVLARKLEELAANHQVIVISHLPQIASRARGHFRISKSARADRVVTQIEALGEGERVEEIARMIAGEHVTEIARANARELIRASRFD